MKINEDDEWRRNEKCQQKFDRWIDMKRRRAMRDESQWEEEDRDILVEDIMETIR